MVFRRLPPEPRPSDVESPPREARELTPESLRPYGYTPLVYPYGVPLSAGPREPIGAGVASAVNFLAGLWLVIAPYPLNYATGVEAQWNDLVVGGVIALLALVRAFAPANVPWFSIVNIALGVWLVVAPLMLGYRGAAATPQAVVNDVVVGFLVIAMASYSAAATHRHREQTHDSPQ